MNKCPNVSLRRWEPLWYLIVTATVMVFISCASCALFTDQKMNIVLISMDTARRDHYCLYGYDLNTTPFLNGLAEECVVFENTISQSVNTGPSHASIFTGLYPHTHGCIFNSSPLPEENLTLAEYLREHDFQTAAFISGYTLKNTLSRLAQGFETYSDDFPSGERPGLDVTREALAWLKEKGQEGAFCLFAHYFDAHGPYRPPEPLNRQFLRTGEERNVQAGFIPRYQRQVNPDGTIRTNIDYYIAQYDGEIRYTDMQIKILLDYLREAGLLENTLVVIFSDHGETLDERFHMLDHGSRVTEEQISIPLLLRFPGGQYGGLRIKDMVQSIDIMPTILDYLGLSFPEHLEGFSLMPLIRGEQENSHPFSFTEGKCKAYRYANMPYQLKSDAVITSIRDVRWKLIELPGQDHPYYELYDLVSDPGETVNLLEARPDKFQELRRQLLAFKAKSKYPDAIFTPPVDEAVWRELKSLGYVQ